MLRSMTGYGDAEEQLPDGRMRVEIKTVNHRYFNAQIRTPPGLDHLEGDIERWLRGHISRGHVHYSLSFEEGQGDAGQPPSALDLARARHYRDLLRELRDELGLAGEVELSHLLRFGDLFRPEERPSLREKIDPEVLRMLTDDAARSLVEMRETEGARLQKDLEARVEAMARQIERIEEHAPERLRSERDRLRKSVRELTEKESVDEDRLAREVAYLAEKLDISEEVVRFRSHLAHFKETLEADSEEPVGKRLGFVVQEMHREGNTIGAKANDPEISRAAVAIKEEIERLREQLENVE